MHEGVCVGGPLAGYVITTKSTKGFVAVDKPAGACWAYYLNRAGEYVLCAQPDPSLVDEADGTRAFDPQRGIDAALGPDLDVVALPGDAVSDPDGEGPQLSTGGAAVYREGMNDGE